MTGRRRSAQGRDAPTQPRASVVDAESVCGTGKRGVGWPRHRLAEVAEIVMGQSPPGETYNTERDGLPFFQGKAEFGAEYPVVTKWCNAPTRVAEAGDILLSVRAPVGPTNIATERCCIGRGLAAIRAHSLLATPRYLHYVLRSSEQDLARRGQGSTFGAIGKDDVAQIPILLPSLSEQRRIVEVLDQAERLRRLRAEADSKADRIFPALLAQAIGSPSSWPSDPRSRALGDLIDPVSGATPSKTNRDYWNGEVPWVSPKDMKRDFLSDAQDHVSQLALDETTLKVVEPDNVLIVVRGMILETAVPQ